MATLRCECGKGYEQDDDNNIWYAYSRKDYFEGNTESIRNRIEIYVCKYCGRMLIDDNRTDKIINMMPDPLRGTPILFECDREEPDLTVSILSVELMKTSPNYENKNWKELSEEEQERFTNQARRILEKYVLRLR